MGLAKFFDRSSPHWRSIIAVVAASGIALSFIGWHIVYGREDRFARQGFDARATDHLLALQNAYSANARVMSSIKQMYDLLMQSM